MSQQLDPRDPNGHKYAFIETCKHLRQEIKKVGEAVKLNTDHPALNLQISQNMDEAIRSTSEASANVWLSYRHLEDAAMRLGKAIQAIDGGKSVYDKTEVPGA